MTGRRNESQISDVIRINAPFRAMIIGVSKVVIEVADQDRAKAFWTEKMGFEVAQDAPYGDERWLEVRAPGADVNLVLDLRAGEATTT